MDDIKVLEIMEKVQDLKMLAWKGGYVSGLGLAKGEKIKPFKKVVNDLVQEIEGLLKDGK